MPKITNIEVLNNKVVVTFETLGRTLKTELTQRYCVWARSRWDFEKEELRRYFIKEGQKGCYLGNGEDWITPKENVYRRNYMLVCNMEVWDLSLIFPNVSFVENDNIKEQIIAEVTSDEYHPLCDNI